MTEDARVREWAWLATVIAREFFHPKIDRDDLEQEALIALMEAVRGFDRERGATFKTFASMCIRRRLATNLKHAGRMRRDWRMEMPREVVAEDGDVLPTVDLIPAGIDSDPHRVAEGRAELARVLRGIGTLSPLERRWLTYALNGGEYASLANGRNKRAENAVDRARLKLRKAA